MGQVYHQNVPSVPYDRVSRFFHALIQGHGQLVYEASVNLLLDAVY
jgi:hypothetical protein